MLPFDQVAANACFEPMRNSVAFPPNIHIYWKLTSETRSGESLPAYVVGQLEVFDWDDYQQYLNGFVPSFERHGGILLATSKQDTKILEGSWAASRTVLLQFPSAENAKDWYTDPEYVELMKVPHRTAKTNLVLVDGLNH